jgi:thymidylate kinase
MRTFTVAFIGPDGVGKTTVGREVERTYPSRVKYLYMGDNVEASNYILPTTRWWRTRGGPQRAGGAKMGPSGPKRHPATGSNPLRRSVKAVRGEIRYVFSLTTRFLEEAYRQVVANRFSKRGYIVLFDRHFILDYYHNDILAAAGKRSVRRRLHGTIVRWLTREPDLVICLDAPGAVVFQRKGEFSPEFLEGRRAQYLSLQNIVKNFAVVNADREVGLVIQDVSRVIADFQERFGQPAPH